MGDIKQSLLLVNACPVTGARQGAQCTPTLHFFEGLYVALLQMFINLNPGVDFLADFIRKT
ncbi:hypothetical protein AXW37_05285 [Yersinia ruckeri]|nr:hypothetical protein UGYR_04810 [Yersinia ruckeri]AUQ42496.1 hypothetical protein NJ56_11660 [Yersinia ruckeri]OEU24162.1 hypothetical protein BI323_08505 [Yersinia ruckeri]OIX35036.1 hypothetical protein AXW19_05275 [Yersinia ruckeri]OIX35321.1 hypothetical protein AXW20_05270 [Yersinia ruckeri]